MIRFVVHDLPPMSTLIRHDIDHPARHDNDFADRLAFQIRSDFFIRFGEGFSRVVVHIRGNVDATAYFAVDLDWQGDGWTIRS